MNNSIKSFSPYIFLIGLVVTIYYKFFFLGYIPFPGDLLVGSYSPWFDYYKIPVQNPLISDVFSQFFLWKYLAIDSFKNLEWPLWNPFSFMGTPLLATYHSAALYPFNIFLLLPKYFGWGIFIFSQSVFAAINFYLFTSTFIKSKIAKFSGVVIFTFGGLMTTWLELGTAIHTIAWLPLSLYSIQKYSDSSKFRYLLLLTISLILIILSGNVQVTVYSFIIVGIFSLVKSLKLSTLAIFIFFAIAICAIQLIPSLDLFQKSIRLTETYTQESNFGLLQTKDALKFFIADFFGNPVTRNYWGFLNYSETSGFVGTLVLPLIIFSYIFLKRSKLNKFFLILLPVSLLLSFENPLSKAIYQVKIPLLTSSYASRMLFIVNFAVSILAVCSLDQISENNQQFNKFIKTLLWSWAVILGILIGTILTREIIIEILKIPPQKEFLEFYLKDSEFSLVNFSVALRNSLLPLILTTFFLFLAISFKLFEKLLPKINFNLLFLMFFLALTFDLGRYFLKFNPFVPQNLIFPNVPAIEFLQKNAVFSRIGREHAEVLPPNTWTAYNLQSLEGYDPLYLNRYGQFMHYLNGGDIKKGNSTRYAELSSKYDSPFIDAANVKYFIGIGRDKNGYIPGELINYHFNEAGYIKAFTDKSAVILENPGVLPRAYFIPLFRVVDKLNVGNIIMADPNFDPRITALLEKDLNVATSSGRGKTSIINYSNNKVEVKTETEADEILILADQFDEGWKAKVDNIETPISPANYVFRAVKVPKGIHVVTFEYLPYSFSIGAKISLVSILALFMITLISLKKRIF